MRTLIVLAALSLATVVFAQEPEEFEAVPEPPDLPEPVESGQPLDQPIEPEITIIRRGDAVVEEYRVNGRHYMSKITPSVGPSYYLVDRDGDGRMETRMSGIQDNLVVPQWVIFSW